MNKKKDKEPKDILGKPAHKTAFPSTQNFKLGGDVMWNPDLAIDNPVPRDSHIGNPLKMERQDDKLNDPYGRKKEFKD